MKSEKLLSLSAGLLAFAGAASGQGISVVSSNGTTTNIPFTEIRSMVFDNHNLHVNRTECQDNYFSLTFTSQVVFAENLGLKDVSGKSPFTVYPNPATDQLHISLTDPSAHRAEIRNLQGGIVQTFDVSGEQTIDVSPLSAGIYFIHIDGTSVKFVKQ